MTLIKQYKTKEETYVLFNDRLKQHYNKTISYDRYSSLCDEKYTFLYHLSSAKNLAIVDIDGLKVLSIVQASDEFDRKLLTVMKKTDILRMPAPHCEYGKFEEQSVVYWKQFCRYIKFFHYLAAVYPHVDNKDFFVSKFLGDDVPPYWYGIAKAIHQGSYSIFSLVNKFEDNPHTQYDHLLPEYDENARLIATCYMLREFKNLGLEVEEDFLYNCMENLSDKVTGEIKFDLEIFFANSNLDEKQKAKLINIINNIAEAK